MSGVHLTLDSSCRSRLSFVRGLLSGRGRGRENVVVDGECKQQH